ncbi:helix-turn-helix transcriptional regulator [Providencia stuartii]|uniref:helix-turn-helix domain-containing protein n=1 Tax=Providencia stuartii TaxID=588 RepID=UPI00309C5C99
MIVEHEVSKNIFMIAVGKEIFRLRKKRGLTGKQLAEKLNVSQQQISRYERGVCNINVDTLFVILHELDCSLSNFFSAVYLSINDAEKKVGSHYINLFLPPSPYYKGEDALSVKMNSLVG